MSWQVKIQSINFVVAPNIVQEVEISYREGGKSDPWSTPVTVYFNPDGTINGTPNPYIINNIDDAWASIEIRCVNTCNAIEETETFNKPA